MASSQTAGFIFLLYYTFSDACNSPAATDTLLRAGLTATEPDLLLGIESAMPDQTVELRQRAAEVTRQLYLRMKESLDQDSAEIGPEVARLANNLANRLSALGRREEALVPAQEAVELRRELVLRSPDDFQPALAMSLGVFGQTLEADERREEALERFAEAVRTLTRQFQSLPHAHVSLMAPLVQDYLRLAQALHQPLDETLLAPVGEVFTRLQKEAQPPAPPQ